MQGDASLCIGFLFFKFNIIDFVCTLKAADALSAAFFLLCINQCYGKAFIENTPAKPKGKNINIICKNRRLRQCNPEYIISLKDLNQHR